MAAVAINRWIRFPVLSDPRIPFVAILTVYVVLGTSFLGFNRSADQVLMTVGAAILLDFVLHRIFRRNEPPLFPLSAAISGLGLSILISYAQGSWWALVPVFLAIASKYVITYEGRHVYNPTAFAVGICLLAFRDIVSLSPPWQWGGSLAVVLFIITAALVLFVFKIQRNHLIVSFLAFYLLATGLRAWVWADIIPPETLFIGVLGSPEFFLITFFMITDPATSPGKPRAQVGMAFAVVLIDLVLQLLLLINTLFLALFAFATLRFFWLHLRRLIKQPRQALAALRPWVFRATVIGSIGFIGVFFYKQLFAVADVIDPGFQLVEINSESAGIRSRPGTALQDVDPRVAHVAKLVLAVGDAVAVADVNNDGRQDIFLTYPLKTAADRAALYLYKGNYIFERFDIPELSKIYSDPASNGLPTGALFLDIDDDGDQDLVMLTYFGKLKIFQNRLIDNRVLRFVDITEQLDIDERTVSVAANFLDMDRDGRLDLVIGSYVNPLLEEYANPTPVNLFKLPPPEFSGDRRMFKFYYDSLSHANNGGGLVLYRNTAKGFEKVDQRILDLEDEARWTFAIGTGDLNNDGWTDLYVANDFGPDHLLLNQQGEGFKQIRGRIRGQLGRDNYKGMNVSIGDVFNKGYQDIYVSNMHVVGQAEGSMLWMNNGIQSVDDLNLIQDRASRVNALNEARWGWGAAMGDLDLDGRLDILQANGMLDNVYDPKPGEVCNDYKTLFEKFSAAPDLTLRYVDSWGDARGVCWFPNQLNRVYLNRGRHFVDVASKVGWTEGGTSRGVALVDLENQGKLDVIVTRQFAPVSIYRNTISNRSWVGVQLQGDGKRCNRDAIGTRVVIHYVDDGEPVQQMREVQAANGFSAQNDRRLLFGLGDFAGEVTAEINWCGRQRQTVPLTNNQYNKLTQPIN